MVRPLLIFCVCIFCIKPFQGNAQKRDSIASPHLRFPVLPPLQLLLTDSATVFTKKELPARRSTWLLLFSPDCTHCQSLAEQVHKQRSALKGINLIWASMLPLHKIKAFAEQYGLNTLPNLMVGKDLYNTLPTFYSVRFLPFHALYNRRGGLVWAGDEALTIERVQRLLR